MSTGAEKKNEMYHKMPVMVAEIHSPGSKIDTLCNKTWDKQRGDFREYLGTFSTSEAAQCPVGSHRKYHSIMLSPPNFLYVNFSCVLGTELSRK